MRPVTWKANLCGVQTLKNGNCRTGFVPEREKKKRIKGGESIANDLNAFIGNWKGV